jgi:hypothetical protein
MCLTPSSSLCNFRYFLLSTGVFKKKEERRREGKEIGRILTSAAATSGCSSVTVFHNLLF